VPDVSVPNTLLGLLEREPSHGYELKRAYDERFGRDRALPYGQVYATLGRLERDGQVQVAGVEPGGGPERKRYAITAAGAEHLERWLQLPELPEPHLQSVMFAKVVLALMSHRSAGGYLDAQRAAHMARMRELTEHRRTADLGERLLVDYALFHLDADLRWIDMTAARLDPLAKEIAR
jgi:DNA-binding PadR family transcriptional regulator